MTEGSSDKGFALFGKKGGLRPSDIKLCIINKFDREEFFQNLRNFGWEEVEEAFEFERNWPEKTLRKAAREHAVEVLADLLVEIRDNDYSTNPFNDYVYYTWRSGPNTRGLPPPPSQTQNKMMTQHMQMITEQQRALIQQQQMLQRMQMQIPPPSPGAPPGVPQGQVCSRCGGNQIQFMANGMARCNRCGSMFRWQQPGQQPVQIQQQPVPQTQPQQQVPQTQPQPQQQSQQVQGQVPQVSPPVQTGAPTPPGSRTCPKCGNVLTVFPDGSFLCNKCGHTGK
jgi:ribosomal protein S27AE